MRATASRKIAEQNAAAGQEQQQEPQQLSITLGELQAGGFLLAARGAILIGAATQPSPRLTPRSRLDRAAGQRRRQQRSRQQRSRRSSRRSSCRSNQSDCA